MASETKSVCVLGSGILGRSWAMIFASGGYNVRLYDVLPSQIDSALSDIGAQMVKLEAKDMLRGKGSAKEQLALIKGCLNFEEAVKGAMYIQECAPEVREIKADVFTRASKVMDKDAIIGSSTSYMAPSLFMEGMEEGARTRAFVAHPVNPPYYAPLVELVPSPWTDAEVMTQARQFMNDLEQAPVTLNKEKMGFSLNRIQVAIIMECWRQVEEGLISLEDVDTVMWAGLGMRYAFCGPLEVAHLNAQGMREYLQKFSRSMIDTAKDFGPIPEASYKDGTPTADAICQKLESMVPLDQLQARRAWRDKRVALLAKLKRDVEKEEK